MKKLWVVFLVAGLALALTLGPGTALAATPPESSNPGSASYVDSATHSVPANGSTWFRFDYAGDRSEITITLPNGADNGLGFQVFTPDQINDWWDLKPIGQGTGSSDNLSWAGNFDSSGTYYVQVVNPTSSVESFQLMIAGDGVSLAKAQPQTPVTQPVPSSTAPSNGQNTSPTHAAALASVSQTLAGNGSLWYRFDYPGDHAQTTITLPNGALNGLQFNVFTTDQINNWWETAPVGRGTGQALNCDSGQPEDNGQCQSNDLTWTDNSGMGGTFYVQVVNPNQNPVAFQLMAQ